MLKENKQSILCYVDFSPLSENLASWISHINRSYDNPIDLLFVIDHNTAGLFGKHYQKEDIEKQLNEFRERCGSPKGENFIREGCNCSVLSQLAEETDAVFCISAVHSRNDVQFLSSSAMVKMLRNSRVPCLVIPKKNNYSQPETVSLGASIKKDQKTVAPWLTYLAKHLSIKVNLYYNSEDRAIKNNMGFIAKLMKKHEVAWETQEITKRMASIDKYCLKNNSITDIHCLYLNKSAGFASRIIGDQDARLIDQSAGLAVFCVNPRNDLFIPCV